ncbi:hypothetical protein SAMN05421503_0421 [Terribacillus aidingensis]|uniref:Uncharacterized protein n=1 Tax=Terribacillus aidingensis TaxID=586416 RepID=A0A285N3Z1_9BACI|nr:hypothetical protein [Terribacillus aidingensis]SNZ03663.1 hypothetical protein SAMN05421503_0421 [Terribacillus aidingensis]
MKDLIDNLKQFLPPFIQVEEAGNMLLLLTENREQCGIVDLDSEGQLIGFDLSVELPAAEGTEPELAASQFASAFYPEANQTVQIEAYEDYTVIRLAESDSKYQLPIPSAGLTAEVHRSGYITAAQLYKHTYTLLDSKKPVSVSAAMENLLEESPIVLTVADGAAAYQLYDQAIGVRADGTVLYSELPPVLMDIEEPEVSGDWAALMGLNELFVNYYQEEGLQLWAEKELVEAHSIEDIPDQVAVRKNEEVIFYSGSTPWQKGELLTKEELQLQALRFLSLVAEGEKPWGQWKLAGAEMAADAAIEDELEPTYIFQFQYVWNGYSIDAVAASIHVGMYTGLIRECIIDRLPRAITDVNILLPVEHAKEQIRDALQLQLAWIALQDENTYELVYVRAASDEVKINL